MRVAQSNQWLRLWSTIGIVVLSCNVLFSTEILPPASDGYTNDTVQLYESLKDISSLMRSNPDSVIAVCDHLILENDLLVRTRNGKGSLHFVAEANYIKGRANRYKSDFKEAKQLYEEAFKTFTTLNDAQGLAKCYHGLGNINFITGNDKYDPYYFEMACKLRDSLNLKAELATSQTNLGIVYYRLGAYDSSEVCMQKSLAIREKLGDTTHIAATLNNMGNLYTITAQYYQALEVYEKGLSLMDTLVYTRGLGSLYNNLGNVKMHLSSYVEALGYFQKAYSIYQSVDDVSRSGQVLLNMGSVNYKMNLFSIANDYINQSLSTFMLVDNQSGMADCYFELGRIFQDQKKYYRAKRYYIAALKIKTELDDTRGMGESYQNLGSIFLQINKQDSAKVNFLKALEYYEDIDYAYGLANVMNNLSTLSLMDLNSKSAISYATKSLESSKDYGGFYEQRESHNNLANAYEDLGSYKKSLYHFKRAKVITDSLFDVKTAESLFDMELKYQSQNMKQAMERQQLMLDKREAVMKSSQREYELQQRIRNLLLLASIILTALILWILRDWLLKTKTNDSLRNQKRDILNKNMELRKLNEESKFQQKQIEEQNDELIEQRDSIERINRHINQGINYAVTIQQAIFPSNEKLGRIMGEHFALYKPKDRVGGDFYYATQKGDFRLIAVGDCTGHGIPGGFLTVLGTSLLKNIISEKNINEPSEILTALRLGIIDSLDQTSSTLRQSDGIDIAIAVINDQSKKLYFSGGRSNVVIVNEEGTQIIRGDRDSVGFAPKMTDFTTSEIQLKGDELIYMYTDGYTDQFNPSQLKIGRKRFVNLCFKLYRKPLSLQKETFLTAFEDWRSGYEQIDDALVFGFKAIKD